MTMRLLSLGALPGGRQGCQTHVHGWELLLRWDLLSQGRDYSLSSRFPDQEECPCHRLTSSL